MTWTGREALAADFADLAVLVESFAMALGCAKRDQHFTQYCEAWLLEAIRFGRWLITSTGPRCEAARGGRD